MSGSASLLFLVTPQFLATFCGWQKNASTSFSVDGKLPLTFDTVPNIGTRRQLVVKCLKDRAVFVGLVCPYAGAMSLFFSAQQLSPKYLGRLTRRRQYFTAAAKCPSVPGSCEDRTDGRRSSPRPAGTCRSSVTARPSTEQQLHRAVHKHRGRIKGGGTR